MSRDTHDTQRRFRLAELTREELRARLREATVVLPTGSTEQHGPHLPLMTDALT
jgi:creatinine amidohydrolase